MIILWSLRQRYMNKDLNCFVQRKQRSAVVQLFAHWPLVLEVPGSIAAAGDDKLGVRARFSSSHLQG